MTYKFFSKLLGLFVLLLVLHTLVLGLLFRTLVEQAAGRTLQLLERQALSAGLISLVLAIALAGWLAKRIASRLESVVAFARRVADGDLTARLDREGEDELSAMEVALNQTAERLGMNFAELESRRHELAAMLDSMQEAVVAITQEGYVRWSNAVMPRIAGTQMRAGR